ncbi:MAG: ABC transporter permease [Anaerolineales bacterium]|nr:ABC transporter permease [Anaerolineales bacterium]
MRNTLLVMRQEIRKTLRSPGYIIFAFVIPVVAVLLVVGLKYLRQRPGEGGSGSTAPAASLEIAVEGFVDLSGLVHQLPAEVSPNRLVRYMDEQAAQAGLRDGSITAYYLVPENYLEQGTVFYVYPDSRSYLDDGQPWVMERTLLFNLLEGDSALCEMVWNPIREVTATSIAPQASQPAGEDCSRPGSACQSNDLVRYIPSMMTALFFATFMVSSSMLLNSIGTEKENRMLEVLMLSISPRQLLTGKTLGLGVAGLLQTIIWLGGIYVAVNLGGTSLNLPAGFAFPADILAWGLVFFLGGFGVYAGMMAGAGALVPRMKEAGAANYIVMAPLFVGYAFGLMAPLTENAGSPLILFLSFFPLTAPVVMMMRLTNGTVPLWQLLVATGMLLALAVYLLRAVAALFHAQNLLSGQPFSLRRYFGVMLGKQ